MIETKTKTSTSKKKLKDWPTNNQCAESYGLGDACWILVQMLNNDSDAELSTGKEALATNPVGHKVRWNWLKITFVKIVTSKELPLSVLGQDPPVGRRTWLKRLEFNRSKHFHFYYWMLLLSFCFVLLQMRSRQSSWTRRRALLNPGPKSTRSIWVII